MAGCFLLKTHFESVFCSLHGQSKNVIISTSEGLIVKKWLKYAVLGELYEKPKCDKRM